jgi:hypothetical protein
LSDDWKVLALHRGARPVVGVKFQGRATAWVNYGTQIGAIIDHLNKAAPDIAGEIMRAQA